MLAAIAAGQIVRAQTGQPSAADKKAATPLTLPPSPIAILPDAFDGWVAAEPPRTVNDVAALDPANVPALKEYGFDFGVVANYKREGETLAIRALRFDDESGAYGAYSYYRQNGWPRESIGTGAASDKNRVLFWRGNTVVDATFSHIGPMSAGELREIADKLPVPGGNKSIAPPVLSYLPQDNLQKQTTHYALGPAGYAGAGAAAQITAELLLHSRTHCPDTLNPRQDDCSQHTCGLDMHALALQHAQGGIAAVEAALDLHGEACWSERLNCAQNYSLAFAGLSYRSDSRYC